MTVPIVLHSTSAMDAMRDMEIFCMDSMVMLRAAVRSSTMVKVEIALTLRRRKRAYRRNPRGTYRAMLLAASGRPMSVTGMVRNRGWSVWGASSAKSKGNSDP